ncbi:hypothetical protein FM113_07855 [Leucobacter sp. 7(1)]|uniref:hypothetical protein n=1 Tax=Leucobacter sp. 7(1) TaxID=1255613 RepID=UPI00097F34F7|nr:hypothetical protein [Leucobacter sp. 7(1)]SJN09975.1 hypothetical protein FM113_07855 [Leucobacter sp. 7(1)]
MHDDARPARRLRAALLGGSIALGSLVLSGVFVRLVLDWSDSRPYEGEITETRYIVFAVIAVCIVFAGIVTAIWSTRRMLRGPTSRSGHRHTKS